MIRSGWADLGIAAMNSLSLKLAFKALQTQKIDTIVAPRP